jgi:hypothetical protein
LWDSLTAASAQAVDETMIASTVKKAVDAFDGHLSKHAVNMKRHGMPAAFLTEEASAAIALVFAASRALKIMPGSINIDGKEKLEPFLQELASAVATAPTKYLVKQACFDSQNLFGKDFKNSAAISQFRVVLQFVRIMSSTSHRSIFMSSAKKALSSLADLYESETVKKAFNFTSPVDADVVAACMRAFKGNLVIVKTAVLHGDLGCVSLAGTVA